MKKVLFSLLAVVLLNIFNLQAQEAPYIVWEKSFGSSFVDHSKGLLQTKDGGYILIGYSKKDDLDVYENKGGSDYWIIRLDRYADTVWTKVLGGGSTDIAYAIKKTQDDNYMIVGSSYSTDGDVHGNQGDSDFWIVKLDEQGDTLWTKSLGGSLSDNPYGMQITKDGGYIIVGTTESTDKYVHGNHGDYDVWVVKLNEEGDTTWCKTFGGSDNDRANAVQQTSDNGYIIVGYSKSSDGDVIENIGDLDQWIIKLDAQGDTLWTQIIGTSESDIAYDVKETSDGNYAVVGKINDKASITLLDHDGNKIWTKTYGGSDLEACKALQVTKNQKFILAGYSSSTNGDVHGNHGDKDFWILKLNEEGDTLWTKSLGGSKSDEAYDIIEDKDGSYVVVGSSYSDDGDIHNHRGNADFWVVKIKEPACLLGDYPFNDSTAYDESGNVNDGQLYGPVPEEDRFGDENSSLHYDGSDDFVIIPHGANDMAEGAISVWVHVETSSPDTFPVFTRPLHDGEFDLALIINNGKPVFTLSDHSIESDITIPHNDWVHIVCTWDGTNMDMYIDAEPHGHDANTNGTANDDGVDLVLANIDSWWAKGHIDDFQIYSCPLSSSEIDSLYHINNWGDDNNDQPGLCIYSSYPFDGDAVDIERGHDGIVEGATPEKDRFNENNMALKLDGSNDSIIIPNGLNYMSKGSFSIWVNINDSSKFNPIFTKIKDGKKWADLFVNHGRIVFTLVDTNTLVSKLVIGNNTWHNITGVWQDSTMALFVDGKLQRHGAMTDGGIPDLSDCDLILGKYTDLYLTGILDDLEIFDCPLSQSDVSKIYHDRNWDIHAFKTECYNLNDNLIPEDYLIDGDSAEIEHGRFMTYDFTDPATLSRLGFIPENVDSVIITWEAPVNRVDSNFNFTGLAVEIADTMVFIIHNQTKDYDQGIFMIDNGGEEGEGPSLLDIDSTEINTGVYRNRLVFTNDNVYFTAYKLSDPSIVPFKMQYNPFLIDSSYTIKEIKMIAFMQMANQALSYNWMDNVCIRLSKTKSDCEIVHYKFNDNLGDASSNAYHLNGKNGPIVFKENRFKETKKAVYLANGQYALVHDIQPVSSSFSLSTWVYPDAYSGTDTSLIFINDINSSNGNNPIMLGVFEATGKLFFGHIVDGDYQLQLSNISLPAQKWTHIVLNRDSIAKKYTLYINGKKESEFIYATQPINASSSLFVISADDDPFHYRGRIDDLRLWSCQINPEQVDSLYHIGGWPKIMCKNMSIDITPTDAACGTDNGKARVSVSNGSGDYAIEWSNGDKGINADSLSSGSHSVQVTDKLYGCMANQFFTINNTDAPVLSVSKTDLLCYGEENASISIDISGGNPPYTVEWSTGENTNTIEDLPVGTYFVTVTDTSHCMITQSVQITQPEAIQVDFSITNSSCGNADGAVTATVSGGTAPYTYLWDIDSTTANVSNLEAGTYTLSVEDKNHCQTTFSTSFSDEGAPMVMVDSVHSVACGEQGGIFVSVSGGSGSYNYKWSNGATTQDINGYAPGEYWLKVTDGSCTNILNTEIPYIYPQKQSICMVTVDTSTATNLIVWERGNDQYVDHYNIYREGYTPDEYLLVESIDANDITEYNDTVASPYKRSWRYKISAVDACGNETALSDNHKTIHLNMNAGLGGSFNLIWDDYEGFDYTTFYIYRKQANAWALIDSLPANLHSYTDTPPSEKGLWYLVTIRREASCLSTSRGTRASGGPYYQSTSNLEDDGIANTGDSPTITQEIAGEIDIYPNPSKGQVIVQAKDIVRIEVITASGQKIRDIQSCNKEKMSINLKKESKGLYFVKVTTKQGVVMQKIVLE